jgi:transcription initiation factor TFIIIB Brf1 subunit/transcription initiation factor TFIIB
MNELDFSKFLSLSNKDMENILDEFEEKNAELNELNMFNENYDCKECKEKDSLIEENGVVLCRLCGLINKTCIDEQPEWRKYEDDKNSNQRCSQVTNHLLPVSSMSIKGNFNQKVTDLQKWFHMPYKERSLLMVYNEMENICQKGGLKKCIEQFAKELYMRLSMSNKITRGQNRRSSIASCIFFACRSNNETRCNEEIVKMFNNVQLQNKDLKISSTRLTKGCSKFNKLTESVNFNLKLNTSNSEHFIRRFCKEIKLFDEYAEKAIQIGKNIDMIEICSTHTPLSIATVTFKILIEHCNLNISKKTLNTNSHLNVTNVTTNKVYKKIKDLIHIITNQDNMKILLNEIDHHKNKPEPDFLIEKLKYIEELEQNLK